MTPALPWSTRPLASGERGIDCNTPLTDAACAALRAYGYQFVARYVPRLAVASHDLSRDEVARIQASGLGLLVVQHVEREPWRPTAEKGGIYGRVAAEQVASIGLPPGGTVVLDLEGVNPLVMRAAILDYCREWYTAVVHRGYRAMLYVGWRCGLTSRELYARLPFTQYWAAYNLPRDQYPARRGVSMRQHQPQEGDVPPGIDFPIDTNTVLADAFGDTPEIWVPSVVLA